MLVLVRDAREVDQSWHIEHALDRYASKTVCHEWLTAAHVDRKVLSNISAVPEGAHICTVCLDHRRLG